MPSRSTRPQSHILKGEDVGGGADFQHHGVGAGAVDGACRDEDVVVLLHGDLVHVFFGRESFFSPLGGLQIVSHGLPVYAGLDAQPYEGIVSLGVQNIIAFILGIAHIEVFLDVLCQRVDLQGEVLAVNGVQHIKTDGKLLAKTGVNLFAQQPVRLGIHQVQGRGLDALTAKSPEAGCFPREHHRSSRHNYSRFPAA